MFVRTFIIWKNLLTGSDPLAEGRKTVTRKIETHMDSAKTDVQWYKEPKLLNWTRGKKSTMNTVMDLILKKSWMYFKLQQNKGYIHFILFSFLGPLAACD